MKQPVIIDGATVYVDSQFGPESRTVLLLKFPTAELAVDLTGHQAQRIRKLNRAVKGSEAFNPELEVVDISDMVSRAVTTARLAGQAEGIERAAEYLQQHEFARAGHCVDEIRALSPDPDYSKRIQGD